MTEKKRELALLDIWGISMMPKRYRPIHYAKVRKGKKGEKERKKERK